MAVITRDARRGRGRVRWDPSALPLVLLLLGAVALPLTITTTVDRLYADRTLPGVTVAGIDVGSLSRADVAARLETALAVPFADAAVVATDGTRTWRTTNGALGIRPDVAAAAGGALAFGKRGRLFDRLAVWPAALRGRIDIPLALRADGDALPRWIDDVAADVDRPAVSGSLAVGPAGLVVTEPVVGAQLDRAATAARLLAATSLGDRAVDLVVRRTYPEVDDSGFRDALARARAVTTPLTIVATAAEGRQGRRWSEDPAGLATLLRIERVPASDLAPLPAGAVAPAQRYRYTVALDERRMSEWVSAVASQLDGPSVSARFAVTREGAVSVVAGAPGTRVDRDQLAALLGSELLTPSLAAREIAAPAAVDTTTFSTAQANEWLPKMTRTSTFTTSFPVSASRHANIAAGASQFDGVVIMPGQTFSFWDLLGPVTVERGYAYAGAIIDNRSDENVIGGGLCQVSTTIFNAVAQQGYEIVERHEHGYLIERYPIGLDAAVFQPGLDLRWRNDTASPVFLWSWVGDTSVTFDVWGAQTGRTVSFTDPVQYRFVDVPKDQPADPAFPKGYAIRGRDVVRTRTVTENGTVLHQDAWYSHYAPVWGGPAEAGQALTIR